MARTDVERYDETYAYLNNLDSTLAAHLDQEVRTNAMTKGEIGKKLSLQGIWSKGHLYRSQHAALRALMLCQAIYLSPPWARKAKYTRSKTKEHDGEVKSVRDGYQDYYTAGTLDVPTSIVRNMSESEIKKRIRCYVPVGGVGTDDVAAAAEAPVGEGTINHNTLTREDGLLFKNAICFDAVSLWLFKSGFVSIRWLTHEGPSLQADTANDMLGLGREITADQLERMPRGMLFNFHAASSKGRDNRDVCHWGVSLGGGYGAAANTTAEETTEDGKKVRVNFRSGDGKYGTFKMRESYEVCRLKYGKEKKVETVIREIDPTVVAGYM
jgi:hypothetical protein